MIELDKDGNEIEEVLEPTPVWLTNVQVSGSYDSIDELIEELRDREKYLIDSSQKWTDLGCRLQVYVEVSTDGEDYGIIDLNIGRSRTPEEKKSIEDKKIADENKVKLKETQLMLAEDDPDYHKYLKLKEKFKHLE